MFATYDNFKIIILQIKKEIKLIIGELIRLKENCIQKDIAYNTIIFLK
jgi:hypothetical protein